MNQCKYKQSQPLSLDLNWIKHINIISKKLEAEVGLKWVGGEKNQQRDPRRREEPTYNDSVQPSVPTGEYPMVRMDASGLLHLLLINNFFQTLDCEV